MRVLFATYSLAFQNPGGGERVMLEIAKQLQNRGHHIDWFTPWNTTTVANYDVIHYFSTLETGFWNFKQESAPAIPLIVTPTWWGRSSSIKTKVLGVFEKFQPTWNQTLSSRTSIPSYWIPTTEQEAKLIQSNWRIPSHRISVIPNGIDEIFFKATPTAFREWSQIKEEFVLHVGRFHPVKNQLALIKAWKNCSIQLVFIGKPDLDYYDYYESCLDAAKRSSGSIRFITNLSLQSTEREDSKALLPSAYAAARAFVLPSQFETFGLSAFEAVAAKTKQVYITKNCAAKNLLGSSVYWINPTQLESLKNLIEKNFNDLSKDLSKDKIDSIKIPNWNEITNQIEQIYKQVRKTS